MENSTIKAWDEMYSNFSDENTIGDMLEGRTEEEGITVRIRLEAQPCSSYFTIPQIGDRPSERFHWTELMGDEEYIDGKQLDVYESPIDGRVFKFLPEYTDVDLDDFETAEEYFAEWNTLYAALILIP